MIIGFGFGSPLVALLMLLVTSLISYGLYRAVQGGRRYRNPERERDRLRQYYRDQRALARRLMNEFDLTDEEIDQKIEQELKGLFRK